MTISDVALIVSDVLASGMITMSSEVLLDREIQVGDIVPDNFAVGGVGRHASVVLNCGVVLDSAVDDDAVLLDPITLSSEESTIVVQYRCLRHWRARVPGGSRRSEEGGRICPPKPGCARSGAPSPGQLPPFLRLTHLNRIRLLTAMLAALVGAGVVSRCPPLWQCRPCCG